MKDIQTETIDSLLGEHYNGSVSGVGAYVSVTSANKIRGGLVYNPRKGPYANNTNKYLKVSLDGRVGWTTLGFGDRLCFGVAPKGNILYIDAGVSGGVGYECVLAVEGSE